MGQRGMRRWVFAVGIGLAGMAVAAEDSDWGTGNLEGIAAARIPSKSAPPPSRSFL